MPQKEKKGSDPRKLLNLRKSLGMTQRQLAKEFMVTAGAIALWETGRRKVPGPVIRLIELYETALNKDKRRP